MSDATIETRTLLVHLHLDLTDDEGVRLDRAYASGAEHYAHATRSVADTALRNVERITYDREHNFVIADAEEI